MERLSKAIAACGVASRRAAEELIRKGLVSVNGEKVFVPQTLVDIDKDIILFNGTALKKETKAYYLLHKPVGYTCTSAPLRSKKRAIDLIGETGCRLYTVGRLDKDTSGLMVVTNDGDFANTLMHPSSEIAKEYLVKVNKEVLHEHLVAISKGTVVEGEHVKPVSVTKVRRGTLKVVVCDGRKREVRALMSHAGFEVIELKRIRIGGLVLGTLPVGQWRTMTEKEKALLLNGRNRARD